MFPVTGFLPFHIRSAVRTNNYLEVQIKTEHLAYQVVIQGALVMVNDRILGDLISTADPMWAAVHQFVNRNHDRIKEVLR